jgi:hypothetical protein
VHALRTLKRHLTVANVLSLTALFVALSASAVAATKLSAGQVKSYNIANQAVTNPKIKTQAVTSGKIKNLGINANDLGTGSVINSKIKTKAVTNNKIGNKAVNARTLGTNAVTTGKIGPEAVAGGKIANEAITSSKLAASFYAQLVRNVSYVNASTPETVEATKSVTAECPAGKQAIGGGARLSGELKEVAITGSSPFSAPSGARTGWSAFAHESGVGPYDDWSLEAFAVCAEL